MTSRLLDISFPDSDDDSDDEFMRRVSAFSFRRKKAQQADNAETPSLTQSSTEPESPSKVVALSAEDVEVKAQKYVAEVRLPVVQNIDHLADIGWRKTSSSKSKRPEMYYPCVRLPRDEARLMFEEGLKATNIAVRFLGSKWKSANQWEQVRATTFYSLHEAKGSATENNSLQFLPLDDEKCLKLFLDQEFGSSPVNAVKRRIDELLVRRSWKQVAENQKKREAKQHKEEEDSSEVLMESSTKSEGMAKDQTVEQKNDRSWSSDDDDSILLSPGTKRKRDVLQPGEIVEYYLPGRVAGNPDVLRQSVILGVAPKKAFPLNLESGDFLGKDHKIRRISKKVRSKMVGDTGSLFRQIASYSLRTSGTDKAVAFIRQVQNMKRSRENHAKSMDEFWQNSSEDSEGKSSEKEEFKKLAGDSTDDIETAPKKSKKADKDQAQVWCKRLTKLLEETEENMKNKRRYVPKITPDELRLIITVWSILEERGVSDAPFAHLGNELDLSVRRLEAILTGDPNHILSEKNKCEILQEIKSWLGTVESTLQ